MPSYNLQYVIAERPPGTISTPKPEHTLEQNYPEHHERLDGTIFKAGWRFKAAFASLLVISLMAALDATSISVALPIMARALRGPTIEVFWSGTSFLLASTVFQPIIGSLSHIFGRKPMIHISLAFFSIGSIIAALANGFNIIIIGRSIQGIGGGGIIALTWIVITDMVPLRERGRWLSLVSAIWAIGTVGGPILGGGFAENVTWRWIFWINLPFIAIGGIMIAIFLKLEHKAISWQTKLRRVDWIGMALFIGSTTGILIPITWGGVQYPWDSWKTLAPLLVSTAGVMAFIVYQELIAPEPLIRTSVFKNITAAVTYLGAIIHGIILWSILYYLPFYYEAVKGFSPIMAGLGLFPQTFTVAPASAIAGIIITRTGKYRWAVWLGWALLTLGMGLLILLDVDTSTSKWIFINLIGGLGAGILFPAMAIATQNAALAKDQAYAATMFSFFRALGQTIGVAVGGVIFQNQMEKKLLTYSLFANTATEFSKDAAQVAEVLRALPPSDATDQLRQSYAYALQHIWIVMTAFSAFASIICVFTKEHPLDQVLDTEQGFHERSE